MKKVFLVLAAAAMFAACNNAKTEETKTGDSAVVKSATDVKMPYVSLYSNAFEMGNPAYAAMIEQGSWKDWETNNLDNMKSWMADTIVAFQSDDAMVQGADSLMARWKRGRAMYTSVTDSVHAATALYNTEKKENWVLIWAKEINVNTKGVKDTVEVMETWRINKDGKADMLLQYDRHRRKQ